MGLLIVWRRLFFLNWGKWLSGTRSPPPSEEGAKHPGALLILDRGKWLSGTRSPPPSEEGGGTAKRCRRER